MFLAQLFKAAWRGGQENAGAMPCGSDAMTPAIPPQHGTNPRPSELATQLPPGTVESSFL